SPTGASVVGRSGRRHVLSCAEADAPGRKTWKHATTISHQVSPQRRVDISPAPSTCV
ncbi:hypothetical protein TGFOU_273830B, partial [Toxoplasma gondii FOU]